MIWIKQQVFAIRFYLCMTGFVFDAELILFGLAPLFLTAATAWILWHVLGKIDPDEVTDTQTFLAFVIVIIPFLMLVYFGPAIIFYDETATWFGSPTTLPLNSASQVILAGTVIYIALTVSIWSHWRKLRESVKEG